MIPPNAHDRRYDLDGLRGIALLLTIFLHFVSRGGYVTPLVPAPIARFLDSFWSGVDIFFVLSGFLIGGIILDKGRTENFFRVFYVRRALRIIPVALVAIAFSYLVIPWVEPSILDAAWVPPYAYLLFINNFWTATGSSSYPPLGPMWSLAIEQQYYLIAPAFLIFVTPRLRNILMLAVIAISPFLRMGHSGFSGWDFTLFRLDGFAAGMLVAVLLRDARFAQLKVQRRKTINAAVAILVAAAILFAFAQLPDLERVAFGVSLNSLAAAGTIVYLHINQGSSVSVTLSRPWFVATGRYSYFLYLMHMPMLILMFILNIPWLLQPVLAFGICLLAARISWQFLESPLISVARHYTGAAQSPVVADSASSGGLRDAR